MSESRWKSCRLTICLLVGAFAGWFLIPGSSSAETIKIGVVKVPSNGAVFIADERGYFAAEGLTLDIIYFDSAQAVPVAVVSGDLDFGTVAMTGALYSLAGQGALRIIAGQSREVPGFHNQAYVVSNRAYAAGLRSLKDLPNHSVAITSIGGPGHYALGLLAEKYGFDLDALRIVGVPSIPTTVSVITGGQTDASVTAPTAALSMVGHGDAHLLGWVGDETPWQFGSIITTRKLADLHQEIATRFLRAYRKGAHDYHDAFTGANEQREDGPDAPAVLAILSKYVGQPAAQLSLGITYLDGEARLDVKDVLHQIEWYKNHGMLKSDVSGDELIDQRYVVALPAN